MAASLLSGTREVCAAACAPSQLGSPCIVGDHTTGDPTVCVCVCACVCVCVCVCACVCVCVGHDYCILHYDQSTHEHCMYLLL